MTRQFIEIPDEFKDAHSLPETARWQEETNTYWPGILKATGQYSYFYTYPEGGRWHPATYSNHEFEQAVSFNTAEEALHYGYALFMLGCFQE